jgi:transglutaminase-like putative cysteine protease
MAALIRALIPDSPVEESGTARAFAWGAFAVTAAAVTIYGQDYLVPALGVAVAGFGHWVSHRGRRRRRSRWQQVLILGLIAACLAYFLLDSVLGLFGGQLPQAHFAILLAAVTSFDLKTRRNLYSSTWISLALLYLAAVYAWDYQFVVFCGAWVGCLGGFWIASHLKRIDAGFSFPVRPVALLAAGGLLLGGGAFALLPQPNASPTNPLVISLPSKLSFHGEMESPALPLVELGADPSGAQSRLDLRYRGRLGDGVVMYVRTGAPAYWRGLVFDTYRDGAWTSSDGSFTTYPAYVEARSLPPPPGPQLGTFVQVFRPVRTLPGVIYAADPVASIYYPASELRRDGYGTWLAPGPLRAGQTYSVVSYLPDHSPAALHKTPAGSGGAEARYLDARQLSGRGAGLARSVAPAGGDTYNTVIAVTGYLQSHYRYSLEIGHVPPGRDPVDWFLFDTGTGYCEQFATAEVLMLRSLGVPARLATGYSTGDYDEVLDQAVVHERDAHAWVEAYFPGHGWVPFDPSPGFPAVASSRIPNRWAASGMARLVPHLTLGSAPVLAASIVWIPLVPAAIAALIGVLAGLAWLWARRRRAEPGQLELIALYERLQRRLRRRRSPPETPLEYSQAVVPGRLEGVLTEVTEAVNRGAYAGRWPSRGELAAIRKRLS